MKNFDVNFDGKTFTLKINGMGFKVDISINVEEFIKRIVAMFKVQLNKPNLKVAGHA